MHPHLEVREPLGSPCLFRHGETHSELDSLGRCGVAYANIWQELMPIEERESVSEVKPSGWINKDYGDLVDGGYLYNRCHLIGFQLARTIQVQEKILLPRDTAHVERVIPDITSPCCLM